jgi:hypothetical protein
MIVSLGRSVIAQVAKSAREVNAALSSQARMMNA